MEFHKEKLTIGTVDKIEIVRVTVRPPRKERPGGDDPMIVLAGLAEDVQDPSYWKVLYWYYEVQVSADAQAHADVWDKVNALIQVDERYCRDDFERTQREKTP